MLSQTDDDKRMPAMVAPRVVQASNVALTIGCFADHEEPHQ